MLAPHNSGYAAKEGMDGPTIVMVNTMIRSISKIDDYKMVSRAILWQCYLFLQSFCKDPKTKQKQTWSCKIQLYFSLHVESQLHYTTNFGSIVEFFAWLFKIINRFFGLASLAFLSLYGIYASSVKNINRFSNVETCEWWDCCWFFVTAKSIGFGQSLTISPVFVVSP